MEHPELHYLGIYSGQPGLRRAGQRHSCRNRAIASLMEEIAWRQWRNPDLERAQTLFLEIVEDSQDRIPIWSWEGMSMDVAEARRSRAANFREVFGEAKVLMTLRHPVDLLESAYFLISVREQVKRGSTVNRLVPIDEWFWNDLQGEIGPHLDYATTAEIFATSFGRDSVEILLFEDLKRNPRAFVDRVCRFLEIDSELGQRLVGRHRENARSKKAFGRLRKVAAPGWRRSLLRALNPKHRRAYLKPRLKAREGRERRELPRLSREARQRVAEMTRDGNRWLIENFGLRLEQNEYPL